MKFILSFFIFFYSYFSFLNAEIISWEKQEAEFCNYLISGLYGETIHIDKKIIDTIESRKIDIIFINKWDNGKPSLHRISYFIKNNKYEKNINNIDQMFCWTGYLE